MTEEEARAWIEARFGARGLLVMEQFVALVLEESQRQNLIAASTTKQIWARHVVDSAQLLLLAEGSPGHWLDIGTGAGFPGIVVAALSDRPTTLVEPRARRAAFLRDCVEALSLSNHVEVIPQKVAQIVVQADVISARAVASIATIINDGAQCSTWNTLWLLPKGSSAQEEVVEAKKMWHGTFHVEQSVTSPDSGIVVALGIRRR